MIIIRKIRFCLFLHLQGFKDFVRLYYRQNDEIHLRILSEGFLSEGSF